MRRAARRDAVSGVRQADLVFVDESGANGRMTRADARSPSHERAVGSAPRNHGTATSLVAALTPAWLPNGSKMLSSC